ncbi:hypothetical protein GCM10007989_02890 [Devosia pacifica]|uniref:Uncharacterized protein n=1 Tax=Devosia pacifica TaxID=1335967 RepID=A0A918RU48_9HYPH|nr:hypothetical protein GCM10007989_02890 [Devosia pacifica]
MIAKGFRRGAALYRCDNRVWVDSACVDKNSARLVSQALTRGFNQFEKQRAHIRAGGTGDAQIARTVVMQWRVEPDHRHPRACQWHLVPSCHDSHRDLVRQGCHSAASTFGPGT